ncbi:MAG: hypothetical protein WC151_04755 [Bacteroidales bacterium]
MHYKIRFILLVSILLFTACKETPVPRPRAYFRIDLPESQFVPFDAGYPYTFQYPAYGQTKIKSPEDSLNFWVDIAFPTFHGALHISYKAIYNNLGIFIEDAFEMVSKHIPKSSGINERHYQYPENNVYGNGFFIKGPEAASPYQFYVTDSTAHFLRGALYFQTLPNNDSLAPVIEFLQKDIETLISTIQWQAKN